jgi:2-oxoisovalerate dehydrogenase E2 component (dihydrolipoyl transacylase)
MAHGDRNLCGWLMPVFKLPDLGEGLTEAEIVMWHVKVGDTVKVDQPVVEVETAKAVVEVPVPFTGVVSALHGEPGETLQVGSPLITVQDSDDVLAPVRPRSQGQTTAGLAAPGILRPGMGGSSPTPDTATSGSVLIGYGTGHGQGRQEHSRRHFVGRLVPAGSQPTAEASTVAAAILESRGPAEVASPVVRRLAREAGVDIRRIEGTGPSGLVTRTDVESAIADQQLLPSTAIDQTATAQPLAQTSRRIPLKGARKAAADKFARSRREIPEATVWVDVDATPLMLLREELNAAGEPKISVLALIARFALAGLIRYPDLNATVESGEIVVSSVIHMGFAAQTERGLVVPVVANAHNMTLDGLAQALAQLTDKARAGTLTPSQLTGGTFTVNNYGIFGVDGSAAIINYPEVAILGIGRIIARPWIVDGQVVARRVGQLTLAFDHRVCDGGTAGGFLRFVADCIERPMTLLRQS